MDCPGSGNDAHHGDAHGSDSILQGAVSHESFADVVSLQGQRAIRSPAVCSAPAVTWRTGRIGSHSSQSRMAAMARRSMVARWKSAERERVRDLMGRCEQGNRRNDRILPCAPLPAGCGRTGSAIRRHCRGSGSGLRSGSSLPVEMGWGTVTSPYGSEGSYLGPVPLSGGFARRVRFCG